jgi:transposase InsO family protein
MYATAFLLLLSALRDSFRGRAALQLELIALRHQLVTMKRVSRRPSLRPTDRMLWVLLSRLLPNWRDMLVIVKPETVIGWHRKGFRLYWTWKLRRRRGGRPPIPHHVRALISRMSRENPLWGAPRIHGELLKLGIEVSEATVSKYLARLPKPPSQTWRTFLGNHAKALASIDFFVLPTATFRLLMVFIVLHHERRQVVHFGVTAHPTAAWVAQQITEAFPWDSAPRYVIRDRDSVYGALVRARIKAMGIEEVVTAPRSPWQNPFVERMIGSIRRECLDHLIVVDERHLRRILASYFDYYHRSRTHLSLGKDSPVPRPVESAKAGKVIALPQVGGLHHRYERLAA